MPRRVIAVFVIVAALTLVGCGAGSSATVEEQVAAEQRTAQATAPGDDASPAPGGGETVTFVAVDIDFSQAPSEVPAGQVTFELVNEGAIVHDVTIEELGDTLVVEAQGGETATGTVELEAATTYTYYCSVPGHRAAGMEGTFTTTG